MSEKHFINDPIKLINGALKSITIANPAVNLDADNKIIFRSRNSSSTGSQVSIVSGGGSGHEPSFAGYVGEGLLSAAVAGTIFASPAAEQIRNCIMRRVDTSKGVLVVIMNYTGDVLNFGMAVEKARASGVEVEMVVVGDDVGVGRKQGGKVGRRGIAGTVLVHKIAGAMAATGASLKDVYEVGQLTAESTVSIGASLSHVHVPGRSAPQGDEGVLTEGEVEVGMGIHNEPGSERVKEDLPGLVKLMLTRMLDSSDDDRNFLQISKEDKVVLLVNNLGGVSVLEMGGIMNEVVEQLQGGWGLKPLRIFSGSYMTSLNGLGFSISVLRLSDKRFARGKSMLELLDAPCEAVGWPVVVPPSAWERKSGELEESIAEDKHKGRRQCNLLLDVGKATRALSAGLKRLIAAEPEITRFDTLVGDGDCGSGLKRGAEAILKLIEQSQLPEDAALYLDAIIQVVEKSMDGTMGALYAIFLNALASEVQEQRVNEPRTITVKDWAQALQQALKALGRYTPAQPGDRTFIDALHPFVNTLVKTGDARTAADSAQAGSEATTQMKASLGRAVYVGGEGWQGIPDPGAYGLAEFLLGFDEGLL